jgi:hypothetical protein
MRKQGAMPGRSSRPVLQMGIAFPETKLPVDPRVRIEVVALLGRLLLEVARRDSEVGDDAP